MSEREKERERGEVGESEMNGRARVVSQGCAGFGKPMWGASLPVCVFAFSAAGSAPRQPQPGGQPPPPRVQA